MILLLFCSVIYIWRQLGSERGSALPKVTQQAGGNPSHWQLPVGSEARESAWHELQGLKSEMCKALPLRGLFSWVKGTVASPPHSL